MGFPDSSAGKESACNAGDPGLIPGPGSSPGEGIGYPLQYSCLGNPMDREAWQATVHGAAKSQTLMHTCSKASPISFIGGHYKHWLIRRPESEH